MSADTSLGALLEARATPEQRRLLDEARAIAKRLETPLYLVGGVVRDLLRTGELRDLDLVVVGDGIDLARRLADKIDARLTIHDRFLTAEIDKAGTRADVVTARDEVYEQPAVLPIVTAGGLQDDLLRRDFTVNSMAYRLWPEGSDEIIDPHGGREDLTNRRLRVLHDRSFFDDPTRILRGVRLGARLDLEMEAQTDDLAKSAIGSGAFEPLSADRLRRELVWLLDAPEVVESLRELERLGFLRFLDIERPLPARQWEVLEQLRALREEAVLERWLSSPVHWWLTFLLALTHGAAKPERTRLAQRLGLDNLLETTLIGGAERVEQVSTLLNAAGVRRSEVKRALDGLTGEELALLAATIDAKGHALIEEWSQSLRELRLGISGNDLVAAGHGPGPKIGRVLEATLDARADGEIGPDQEMEFALAQLAGENAGVGPES